MRKLRRLRPSSADETFENHVANALELIEDLLPDSGIDKGVGELLSLLKSKNRIRPSTRPSQLAGYNGLTGIIFLNPETLGFLKHDFGLQRERLDETANPERYQQVEDAEMRALFELSGILIHEGQHAYAPIRSVLQPLKAKARDEHQAFASEQLWYKRLLSEFGERYAEPIKQLARSAQEDARTAVRYKRLSLVAPSLIEGEEAEPGEPDLTGPSEEVV